MTAKPPSNYTIAANGEPPPIPSSQSPAQQRICSETLLPEAPIKDAVGRLRLLALIYIILGIALHLITGLIGFLRVGNPLLKNLAGSAQDPGKTGRGQADPPRNPRAPSGKRC
ncbi:hypothetical protein ACFLU6_11080 [Acidobacteriota bacterium]